MRGRVERCAIAMMREGGDQGRPAVLGEGDSAEVLQELARKLGHRARGLSGMQLGVTPL